MENIKREIRLFFVTYGKLLFYFIGIIAFAILIIQGLNNITIVTNTKKNETVNKNYFITQKETEETKKEKEYISQFVEFCNTGKIKEAYDMISDKNKIEDYGDVETFKSEYIKKVFEINICNYKITKKDNVYIVTLTQNMIITGKTNSIIEEKYIIEGVQEQKIYICKE